VSPDQAGVRVVGSGADNDDEPEIVADEGAPRSRPSVTTIALIVVALLGIFGTVFFGVKYRQLSNQNHDKTAVAKLSSDFLNALTNFNASTIDADFNRVQSYATGDFQGQALTFFSSDVRAALAKVQATSRGQIRSLYVESIQSDTATTYAVVDQTIANLNFAHPEQDELRIVLSLKKLSQGWRISNVTVLQAPTTPAPAAPASTTTTTKAP
jgi:hypothetical protein